MNGELTVAPKVFIEKDGTIIIPGLGGTYLKGDLQGNGNRLKTL